MQSTHEGSFCCINPLDTSSNKITTNYTYNDQGGITGTTTNSSQLSGKSITTSSTYTGYGNFLQSMTDARGKTTNYSYNHASGLLNYILDPNLNQVYYNYDTRQRLQNVFLDADKDGVFDIAETGVQYSYASNRLSGITTGSTAYNFSYNSFGSSTGVGITGWGNLASYTYNNFNGKITRTTLGNGFYIENDYDELDRVVAIRYNGAVKVEFTHNGQGQLYSKKDYINNTTTFYEYDSFGRLIRGREMSGTGDTLTLKLGVQNLYDSYGRPKSTAYDFGDKTINYIVSYYDTTTTSKLNLRYQDNFNFNGTTTVTSYGYDKLHRLSSSSVLHSLTSV